MFVIKIVEMNEINEERVKLKEIELPNKGSVIILRGLRLHELAFDGSLAPNLT